MQIAIETQEERGNKLPERAAFQSYDVCMSPASPERAALRVGFIGLGNMGKPMAERVLRAGFPLTVYSRTMSRAEPLVAEGARAAASPAEVARGTDVVLACLSSVAASLEVFLKRDGVLEAARPGLLVVDHSTIDVATARGLHAALSAKGASFLDAPISGGPVGAADGSLSIMVGGDRESHDRCLPVFRALGRKVVHMGPTGSGTAAKLANQLLVSVGTIAVCEAFLLAEREGVDLGRLQEVLEESWGASRMLSRNAPVIAGRKIGPSAAPARNLAKDTALILSICKARGLSLPLVSQAAALFEELVALGRGEWDIAAALTLLEERSLPPAS